MRSDNGFDPRFYKGALAPNGVSNSDADADNLSHIEHLLRKTDFAARTRSARYYSVHLAAVRQALHFTTTESDSDDDNGTHGDNGIHGDDGTYGGAESEWLRDVSPSLDDAPLSIEQALMLEQIRKEMCFDDNPVTIGRYTLRKRLSAGGMGVVYLAFDPHMDREVALKLYRRRVEIMCDGRDEAHSTGKLSHPNVVTVYEHGKWDGLSYIVMALVRGPTLRQWLQEHRSYSEILEVFATLAIGLQAVHDKGLVHGDFKLENVIVESGSVPKIIDFGMAVTTGEHLRGGTLENMSVELLEHIEDIECSQEPQARAAIEHTPITPSVDQFSFFVALFRALVDFHPFGSQDEFSETLRRSGKPSDDVQREFRSYLSQSQRQRNIRWPRGEIRRIPWGLRRVIARGLDPEAGARYVDMNAVAVALQQPAVVARRMKWTTAIVIGAAALTAAVARIATPAPCAGVDAPLLEVWSESQQGQLPEEGRTMWTSVFDAYASRWYNERQEVCETHYTDEATSAELFDTQNACLNLRLDEFRQVIDAVAHSRLKPYAYTTAVNLLRAPEFCVLAYDSPNDEESVSQEQAQLHRARLAAELDGDFDAGMASINRALEAGDAYDPLRAAALFERGRLVVMHHAGAASGENKMEDAANDLTTAIDMASGLGDRGLLVFARLFRLRTGAALNWDTVRSDAQFLKTVPANKLGETVQAQVLDSLAMANYRDFLHTQDQKVLATSIKGYTQAVASYRKHKNVYDEAKALENLGDASMMTSACYDANECELAVEAYQQAINLWTEDPRYGAGLPFLGTLFARLINARADAGKDAKPECQQAFEWLDMAKPPNADVRGAEIAAVCVKAYASEPAKVVAYAEQSSAATPGAHAGALVVAAEALLSTDRTSSEHLDQAEQFLTNFDRLFAAHRSTGQIPLENAEIASRWRGRLRLRQGRYAQAADLLRQTREQYTRAQADPDEIASIDRDLKAAVAYLKPPTIPSRQ